MMPDMAHKFFTDTFGVTMELGLVVENTMGLNGGSTTRYLQYLIT